MEHPKLKEICASHVIEFACFLDLNFQSCDLIDVNNFITGAEEGGKGEEEGEGGRGRGRGRGKGRGKGEGGRGKGKGEGEGEGGRGKGEGGRGKGGCGTPEPFSRLCPYIHLHSHCNENR